MRFTTDGLIVREKNAGENDRLVVALTRDRGLVTAFATGARNFKSRTTSSTALLAFSKITFYSGRDTYRINEATPIEIFFEIRLDIEHLAIAQYFCELLLNLAPSEEAADDFLNLALTALYHIKMQSRPLLLIKSAFELRILTLAGYMPDLRGCFACGNEETRPLYFDKRSAHLFCSDCSDTTNLFKFSNGVLSAMRHIISSPIKKVFSFSLPEQDMKTLNIVTEDYMHSCTEQTYATLSFYKSLF